ncbi:hypothetical protein BDZ89DRAFT_1086134 [Hymenopellis radicata]|nr:hypothetical protein BDZ89DRAFT_1086134 [Hymenopellis radicata]
MGRRHPCLLVLAIPVHILLEFLACLEHQIMRLMSLWDMLVDIPMTLRRRRTARIIPSPILPPELWHVVFANCGNRSTLLACSLVCSAWASISRDQLRLKMSMHNRERAVQLGHLLRSPVQTLTRATHCASFGGQDFGQHWRVLRLLHLRGTRLRSAIIKGDAHATFLLLRYFPDIVDLTFESKPDSAYLPGGVVEPAEELGKFLSQVSRFKSLRSLCINVEYGRRLKVPVVDKESPDILPITRLSVGGMWSSDLFDWLQSSCRGLETLALLGAKELMSPAIMLRANADTLRHLQLTVPRMYAPLNLAVIKDLCSLILKLTDDSRACVDCAVKILQSLDPLRLPQEVRVQFNHSFSDEQVSRFSEILGGNLGMTLVVTGCEVCRSWVPFGSTNGRQVGDN